jgi:hypothetical protein
MKRGHEDVYEVNKPSKVSQHTRLTLNRLKRMTLRSYIINFRCKDNVNNRFKITDEYLNFKYTKKFLKTYEDFFFGQDRPTQHYLSTYTIEHYEGRDRINPDIIDGIFAKIPKLEEPMIVYRRFDGLIKFGNNNIDMEGHLWQSTTLDKQNCQFTSNTEHRLSQCMIIFIPKETPIIPLFLYYRYNDNHMYKSNQIEVLLPRTGKLIRTDFISSNNNYPIYIYSQTGTILDISKEQIDLTLSEDSLFAPPPPPPPPPAFAPPAFAPPAFAPPAFAPPALALAIDTEYENDEANKYEALHKNPDHGGPKASFGFSDDSDPDSESDGEELPPKGGSHQHKKKKTKNKKTKNKKTKNKKSKNKKSKNKKSKNKKSKNKRVRIKHNN